MKKSIVAVGLCGALLATGCNQVIDNQSPNTVRDQNVTVAERNERTQVMNHTPGTKDEHSQFGYVRQQKANKNGHNPMTESAYFDRELMAETITNMAVYLPGVHDVATLVTDKYALVVYDAEADDDERERVADQVKRTAYSVLPRFYDVYVSDNRENMEAIERFSSLGSHSPEVNDLLEPTIEEMKQSPQGYDDEAYREMHLNRDDGGVTAKSNNNR
ncbi:YhcN/YlaJ family sporulation lipoprotein [Desertibacillus haloalkaliphilus]|uniref:YhcN/YlaJ family sporulation lipoprotein n=1 Tax=Desertibacillus haloalkaliphilus TaxID=1328930 RepID=UPI001C27F98B|nr:YhcN/YlaJ family sporulation lipoprotein [Desertibacillus haloalkaliphilus]MBU8906572.1 YhcN/YlaJ family sporulation lipoprotein [Desertibacillus haloalkaliphilus]